MTTGQTGSSARGRIRPDFVGMAVDAFRLRQMPRGAAHPDPRLPDPRLPAAYLDDPTLRYGDVIAVEGRLIVFRGSGLPPHRPSDFREIGAAGTLGGVHDRELRDIDNALARNGRAALTNRGSKP